MSYAAHVKSATAAISMLLLAACSSGSPAATSSSTPIRSTAAGSGPSAAGCQLPVVIRTFDHTTGMWSPDTTGFLTYPGGKFTAANATGVRYDAQRHRWLPEGLPTPDGGAYLYAVDCTAIHGEKVDSGRGEVILAGA